MRQTVKSQIFRLQKIHVEEVLGRAWGLVCCSSAEHSRAVEQPELSGSLAGGGDSRAASRNSRWKQGGLEKLAVSHHLSADSCARGIIR